MLSTVTQALRATQLQQQQQQVQQQNQQQVLLAQMEQNITAVRREQMLSEQRLLAGTELTRTNPLAEDWIVSETLKRDLEVLYLFWDIERQDWETQHQGLIRNRIWLRVVTCLPKFMTRNLVEGDVLGAYKAVVLLGEDDSETQVQDLLTELAQIQGKGRTTMVDWLDMLDERNSKENNKAIPS